MTYVHGTTTGVQLEAGGGDMHAFLSLGFNPNLTVQYREQWDGRRRGHRLGGADGAARNVQAIRDVRGGLC